MNLDKIKYERLSKTEEYLFDFYNDMVKSQKTDDIIYSYCGMNYFIYNILTCELRYHENLAFNALLTGRCKELDEFNKILSDTFILFFNLSVKQTIKFP